MCALWIKNWQGDDVVKNVTIALNEKTLAAGREYARAHHTSLNNLIRELVEKATSQTSSDTWLKEFFELGDKAKGNSRGAKWKREDIYDV
jgi:hypothetical protein